MKIHKTSLIKSTSIFSGMTFLSRLLGFIRDVIVAGVFGATPFLDAFFVAFKIPNFMRRLFAEGAFTQSFVPVLSEYQKTSNDFDTKKFIGKIGGTLASATLIVSIVGIICAPVIVSIFAPGFVQDEDPTRFMYATQFLRFTFPYLFFISMTAFCGAILNAYGYYGAPAFAPIWLNVSMIGGALYLTGFFDIPMWGLVSGVCIAGVLQFLFLLPFLSTKKLLPKFSIAWHDPGVRKVLKAMIPALFGVSIAQLNLLIDTAFASFLIHGSVAWLYFSDRLMNFPLGIMGVALSTVILPRLSRTFIDADGQAFSKVFHWASKMAMLSAIPAMLGLIYLAAPIMLTLFQRGNFSYHDAIMTSKSLIGFAFGLPAFMLIKVLTSAMYSQKNYKTPVKIGAISMLVNLILNIILIKPFAHAGLAFATSIAAYVNAGLLWFYLRKSPLYVNFDAWTKFFTQLLITSGLMLGWLIFWSPEISVWLDFSSIKKVLYLLGLVGSSLIIYLLGLVLTGIRKKDLQGPIEA